MYLSRLPKKLLIHVVDHSDCVVFFGFIREEAKRSIGTHLCIYSSSLKSTKESSPASSLSEALSQSFILLAFMAKSSSNTDHDEPPFLDEDDDEAAAVFADDFVVWARQRVKWK